MITLKNINKYYNKNKTNEIHVINNANLEFPDTGLVTLLGKSGCGKTTLLNVMSGLDECNSGQIKIDDINIDKYKPSKWDSIRSKKIGYVFQNYYLFNDKTVFENLKLALNLAGLYNEDEVNERIDYALKLVGLSKYKKRKPKSLSGGQQQRVGIARAIVKSPSVIIADEPTGNLDSKNTFEIMDILKSISKFCLVVLVTHEKNIANFFSDRIISIVDGKVVSDELNSKTYSLDTKASNEIYLKDLELKVDKINNLNIEYFTDKKENTDINLKIIEKDGKIYIQSDSSKPISYVDDESEIVIKNEAYEEKSNQKHKSLDIDKNILKPIVSEKKGEAIKTTVAFKNAFYKYFSVPFKKKFGSHLLLFALSFVLVFAFAVGANTLFFNESSYKRDKSVVTVKKTDYNTVINAPNIDLISLNGFISVTSTESKPNFVGRTDFYPYEKDMQVLFGKAKPDAGEAVLFAPTVNDALVNLKSQGIKQASFLLNEKVSFYANNYIYEGEKIIGSKTVTREFKIVGIVKSNTTGCLILPDELKNILDEIKTKEMNIDFVLFSNNKTNTTKYFSKNNIENSDVYLKTVNDFKRQKKAVYSVTLIALIVVIVLNFFISERNVKASFINRIKEIGTYRCIGANKFSISKEFIFEGGLKTLFSSFIGFMLASVLAVRLEMATKSLSLLPIGIYYPWWLIIIVASLSLFLNVGLYFVRVQMLMRKTPSMIMAKYDI